jgi:LmbE family N-acetylglucosaminyl deacetylase
METFCRPLILAPHFDDELMGAGGTLLFLSARGAQITVCFITDGSAGFSGGLTREELVIERKKENAIVSRELGYKSICLDYADGALEHQVDCAKESVLEVVRRVNPDVLFCPFFFDHHADHRAAALISVRALIDGGFRQLPLFCYMVGAPIPPQYVNAAIDISEFVDRKRKLLYLYPSQIEMGFHRVLDYNLYNGIIYLRKRRPAEIFHRTDALRYDALIRKFLSSLSRKHFEQIPVLYRCSRFVSSMVYADLVGKRIRRRLRRAVSG